MLQHQPGGPVQAAGEMRHHGIHGDHQVERSDHLCQSGKVRRAADRLRVQDRLRPGGEWRCDGSGQ